MIILQMIVTSSLIGSLIWIILKALTPATKKMFSSKWHYYTMFISVLFFLNAALPFVTVFQRLRIFLEQTKVIDSAQSATPVQPVNIVAPLPITAADILVSINLRQIIDIITPYILIIWLTGVLFFFVFKIKEYLILRKKILKTSVEFPNLFGTVRVIKSGYVATPIIMGVFKPLVVLPDISIGEQELEMILTHEITHLKRGDIILKLIALCANVLHWFNPAAYLVNRQIDRLCEVACDEKIARDMPKEKRIFYCETILSMLENGTAQKNTVSAGLCSSKKYIKERMVNIMNTKKFKKPFIILSIIAVMFIFSIGGTIAYAVSRDRAMPESQGIENNVRSFETTEYKCLQDLSEPLQTLGLMFIDGSVLPHIPNSLNEENPHIGRLSENTPILISSEKDVDILLQAIRLCTVGAISFDTGISDAIAKAGLEDYYINGIREITRPYREQAIIEQATNYSFSELVERVFIYRPEMLAEFQELGFFQSYELDNSAQKPRSYGRILGDADTVVLEDGLFVDENGVIREK